MIPQDGSDSCLWKDVASQEAPLLLRACPTRQTSCIFQCFFFLFLFSSCHCVWNRCQQYTVQLDFLNSRSWDILQEKNLCQSVPENFFLPQFLSPQKTHLHLEQYPVRHDSGQETGATHLLKGLIYLSPTVHDEGWKKKKEEKSCKLRAS